MSSELTIYSPKKHKITFENIQNHPTLDTWSIVAINESGEVENVSKNVLTEGLYYGWIKSTLNANEAIEFLTEKKDLLQSKLNDCSMATFELYIENPYSIKDEYEKDEIKELVEEMGKEYVKALKKAKVRYTTRINSGCGDLSGSFQDAMNNTLLDLTNGFLADE